MKKSGNVYEKQIIRISDIQKVYMEYTNILLDQWGDFTISQQPRGDVQETTVGLRCRRLEKELPMSHGDD